jgi:hypothetical protein
VTEHVQEAIKGDDANKVVENVPDSGHNGQQCVDVPSNTAKPVVDATSLVDDLHVKPEVQPPADVECAVAPRKIVAQPPVKARPLVGPTRKPMEEYSDSEDYSDYDSDSDGRHLKTGNLCLVFRSDFSLPNLNSLFKLTAPFKKLF